MDENKQKNRSVSRVSEKLLRTQPCPVCNNAMGDMPGSRDAYCSNCGYKDPCCE